MIMKNRLRFGLLPLLIFLALIMGASFAANETASSEKINVTKSTNITNATMNITTPVTNISKLKNLTITTNVSKLR
jgi:hypothetical protein